MMPRPSRRTFMAADSIRNGARPDARGSAAAFAAEYDDHGAQHDIEVEEQALVLHVHEVALEPLGKRGVAAAGDLLESGDPGFRLEPPQLPHVVPMHHAKLFGPGSHDAHLATQHVPELRDLVEPAPPHEA